MNQVLNHLLWIEELLPDEVISKKMFGGVGYYLDDKLVLILVEYSRTRDYKGVKYSFEIWHGCLFPVVPMKQTVVWSKFQNLENHPGNKDWLYLPADTEEFENEVKILVRELKKRNPLFGVFIKTNLLEETKPDFFDMSKPRLFNNGLVVEKKGIKQKPVKSSPKKTKANKKPGNSHVLALLKGRKL